MQPTFKRFRLNSSCFNIKNKKLKMESSSQENQNSSELVRMPWEDITEIIVYKDENITNVFSRWELIQKQLHDSTPITNVDQLVNVLKSYNITIGKDGKQMKPYWRCLALQQYFSQLDEYDRNKFFKENGILSTVRNLALQIKDLVPNLKLLKSGCADSLNLHQIQVASILANAFFCTFPKTKADTPSINFNTLYDCSSTSRNCVEKIKCIMHYFKRIHTKQPTGNLLFHRLFIPDHKLPRWDKTSADLCSLQVDVNGKIEDQEGFLQMDFANRYVGGGVLNRGCVQEEIRFVICPELIATRLFTESLSDTEALLVIGAERYSHYTGYADTFRFNGDYQDTTPFDENRQRKTFIIVLDALYFHQSSEQYRESKILRELKKAYVGFKKVEGMKVLPLATGNWGCGAFGGDPQLKTILQLMASSQAKRDMLYLTFGDSLLKKQILEVYQILKEKAVNVGMLYRIIRLYNREKRKNQTVFEFVKESVNRGTPSSSKQRSVIEFSVPKKQSFKVEKKQTEVNNYPQLDLDFEALDREIQSQEVKSKSCDSISVEPQSPSLLDTIWFENECGSGAQLKRKRERAVSDDIEKMDVLEGSESDTVEMHCEDQSSDDMFVQDSDPENNVRVVEAKKSLVSEIPSKKFVQQKITEMFKK